MANLPVDLSAVGVQCPARERVAAAARQRSRHPDRSGMQIVDIVQHKEGTLQPRGACNP
jgi:hypothetical protein